MIDNTNFGNVGWWNFKTKQYDYRKVDTDEIAEQMIEQIEPLIGIYRCYRGLGDSIETALLKTLEKQLEMYK